MFLPAAFNGQKTESSPLGEEIQMLFASSEVKVDTLQKKFYCGFLLEISY